MVRTHCRRGWDGIWVVVIALIALRIMVWTDMVEIMLVVHVPRWHVSIGDKRQRSGFRVDCLTRILVR